MRTNTLPDRRYGVARTYAMIDGMLDMLTLGLVCIRSNGEVMYANKSGEEMLARSGILLNHLDRPLTKSKINEATLKKLCLESHQTTVIRNKNCELQIQVAPFCNDATDDETEAERRRGAMLILQESGRVCLPSPEQLKSLYQLTHAETRLALQLCAGNTPTECAENLAVSITTVRTQLRALMEKTESHRQAELLTKLLASPSTTIQVA